MVALLLILIPLIAGFISFTFKEEKTAKLWAVIASFISLSIAVYAWMLPSNNEMLAADFEWLPALGSRFSIGLNGLSIMLCMLNAITMFVIFLSTYKNHYKNTRSFYALMMLTQAGMNCVFMAADLLLFYFGWELALIPAYFLCSMWGGETRIAVTFKFFIYTFFGSLLMLVGILYLYFNNPAASFAMNDLYNLKLSGSQQNFAFILFFIAFAIKMPVFPFHTWQPDTYEVSETAVTMVLSAVMVKMGLFAAIVWLLPMFPEATSYFSHVIIILSVISLLYASFIALKQNDLKRLIAYSSIAHIGLMSAAIFTQNNTGMHGVMVQMFNHGIVVLGLWLVADAIEKKTGTRKLNELGGLAQKAPALAISLVVLAFANIALPLTNSFIGEFLMFNGLFQYSVGITAFAIISIILSAAYTLRMVQKIFFGQTNTLTHQAHEADRPMTVMLFLVCVLVIALGVFPKPLLELTQHAVAGIIAKLNF